MRSGSLIALSTVLVGACGIADLRVDVPSVELSLRTNHRKTELDLVCSTLASRSFTAIVRHTLSHADYGYDWKRLSLEPSPLQTSCRAESRTIGVFVPFTPSSEELKSRQFFLVIEGERSIYRVEVRGNLSRVHVTSIDDAERALPAQLKEPEPWPNSTAWSDRIKAELDYYISTQWRPSDNIAISRITADGDGTIHSVELELSPTFVPPAPAQRTKQSSYDATRYSGGDGLTRETAVVVGTPSHRGGVALEYAWLREHYPGYNRGQQLVTGRIDGKRYDVLEIQTQDERPVTIWFDITAFFP